MGQLLHLRAAKTSVVLDCRGQGLPRILHWGVDLGPLDGPDLEAFALSRDPQLVSNSQDTRVPLALLPEHSAGWSGTPGLVAHRDGVDFSTAFTCTGITLSTRSDWSQVVQVEAEDKAAGVGLTIDLELHAAGVLRVRAALTNLLDVPLTVDAVLPALPVPDRAREVLDLTGRHLRERSPQRHEFTLGTHLRENRRGRTGVDATLLHAAGERGFGFRGGEVWSLHVAWSGNHRTFAERTNSGVSLLGGGELLLPGEVRLEPGATYDAPWLFVSSGRGLDDMAARFHSFLRQRPHHPKEPRPVTLNTWEAVY